MSIRKKTIILVTIIAVAISAIAIFAIIPTIKNIKNISFKVNLMKIEVEKDYDNRITLRNAIEKLRKIQTATENFLDIYIKKNEELELITSLEDIADRYSLSQEINLMYAKETAPTEEKNQVGIQISLKGDYMNIIRYLYDLRRMPYYINFSSIAVNKFLKDQNRVEKEKESPPVQANLSGAFFTIPQINKSIQE